jgi:hypothetical protein
VVCTSRIVRSRSPRRLIPACALAAFLAVAPAYADEAAPPKPAAPLTMGPQAAPSPAPPAATLPAPAEVETELRPLARRVEGDVRLFGSLEFGRGFRFNNPFRLATQLGQTAQSVSLTAPYADLGIAAVYGPPDGLQHGGSLHVSFAMAGVAQAVLTPAYTLAYRGPRPFLAYGRVGPSFILTPDPSLGGEVAAGFAWFLTGKLALAGEMVFDLYYGAGTYQVGIATYPILSGQLGFLVEHELLP